MLYHHRTVISDVIDVTQKSALKQLLLITIGIFKTKELSFNHLFAICIMMY